MVVSFLGRLVLEKGLDVFADAIDAARAMGVPLTGRRDRRRPGARLFPGAAARRHLHRPADRRRPGHRPGVDRRLPQSVDHRGVRQCHAGSDGLRAAGHRGRSVRHDQPGAGRCHRSPGRAGRYRRHGRRSWPTISAIQRFAPAWRGRSGFRQDDGLGRDQRRRACTSTNGSSNGGGGSIVFLPSLP